MNSIIDKTAIQNVIKQYTGIDDADEARNKLLSRGLFSKARDSAEETRGKVASAVSKSAEDALASVAGLTNLTISKRTLPEDQETPELPEDQPGELFDDPAMRTFEPDLYEARREKPTDAQDISDSNDADGGAASGKEFDDTVKAFLELNEGNKNEPYKDSRGNWTVGIGHYIGKTLPERFKNADGTPKILTDTQVQMLFEKDYKEHKEDASKLPMYNQLDNKGKQALIDLTFNMGNEVFNENEWPKFFAALENKDLKTAAKELKNSKWYNQVADRAPRVVKLIKGAKFI
tara:strand:+ start:798 stop:1667 length:870 start_codon:yes stop_codon:yes gene_type:complete